MIRAALVAAALFGAALPALAAEDAQVSIEARLQRAEDEIAIARLIDDYAAALEARDVEAYVSLFARDAEWINGSMVRKGEADIRALVTGLWTNRPPGRDSLELTSNPEIDVAGDRARVRSYHLLFRKDAQGRPQSVLAGRYDDEVVREDGTWKFLRRVDQPIMPTAEEWRAIMDARRAQQAAQAPAERR